MPNEPNDTSWWDRLVERVSQKQAPPPPAPQPPKVDQGAWEKSVERARISDHLTVRDLGLIVFNETQSYSDRQDSNEPISAAREKMAHAIMNGDQKHGAKRQQIAGTALPIEPSANALRNPAVRTAYDSSTKAAREAYLSGSDPTNGGLHLNAREDARRSNWRPKGMLPPGKPLKTQSGPYNNSYTEGDTPSRMVWLNTYEP